MWSQAVWSTTVEYKSLMYGLNHPMFLCSHPQGTITNMFEESVVQPLLVTSSAITLATETVRMILKIDDIVPVRW